MEHKFDKAEYEQKEAAKTAAKTTVKAAGNIKDLADRVAAIEKIIGV